MQITEQVLVPPNSIRRVPDGAATIMPDPREPRLPKQYVELNRYGLVFAMRQFEITGWQKPNDEPKHLRFGDLFQSLLRLSRCAKTFYARHGYHGNLLLQISVHHVLGRAMRFVDQRFMEVDRVDDFTCHTDQVSAERFGTVDEILGESETLLDILCELTWAFWQSFKDHPRDRVKEKVQLLRNEIGL
jgi:hypothetical protein